MHLSDLHLGNDFIPRSLFSGRKWWKKVRPEITNGLIEAIRMQKPDYLIISGDFVNKQSWSCFAYAAQYLKDVFQASGFDMKERLLVIPGNHDVSFFPKKHPRDDRRLGMFSSFLKELFNETDSDTRRHRYAKIDINHKIVFLCLDSTLKSAIPKAEGEIGISQLRWARAKLNSIQGQIGPVFDEYVKIAVMHHHPIGIVGLSPASEQFMQLLDGEDILKLLEEYHFDVLLHGHKHVPRVTTKIRDDSGNLTIIGAGTATCPYLEDQGNYGNNFNLIDLFPADSRGSIKRMKANAVGVFETEMDKAFSLFAVPRDGYSTRRFRKVVSISADGNTAITVERQQLRTHMGVVMHKLPLKIVASTPGAKISDFKLMCSSGKVDWKIRDDSEHDGEFVFHSPLTETSKPADILYRYSIINGTAMSAAELSKRYAKEVQPIESTSIHISGSAFYAEIEVTFPHDFKPGNLRCTAKRHGAVVALDPVKHRLALEADPATNSFKLVLGNPPVNHSISLEWDLP
jgi:3',5'-cyclic AMP phosphodiesterase CpdA